MENYFKVLLKGCLKLEKGDKLFVTMSYNDQKFIDCLLDVCYEMEIDDISIDYYENNDSRAWGNYIESGAKFLFLINKNFYNTLANRILNGFRCEDIGIDYLAAPTFEMLSKYDHNYGYMMNSDALINFSKDNSMYNKKLTTFKNYKFNELLISSLSGISLKLEFDNDFKYRRTGVINMFPYYGIDLLPYRDIVKGYVDASKPTMIDGNPVEGLRLVIENGAIVDFDSDNNHELLKETFRRKSTCKVESVSLIGSDTPLYNYLGTYNHDVFDMNANSYITLVLSDLRKIYVPIESKSLSVIGITNNGSKVRIYEKERMLIF